MEQNKEILKKLYSSGKREIRPMDLISLKFNFNGLFTRQSVAFGVITYYFWKDVKYGEYLLERVEKSGQTEDNNPKYFIKKIEDDNSPEENDMNIIKDFLLDTDVDLTQLVRDIWKISLIRYLNGFQTNKTQGGIM